MRLKLATYSLPLIFALSVANAESTVSASGGDWAAADTWTDSSVPTTSSTTPLDVLSFTSGNTTLDISSNQYINKINIASNNNTIINIAEGAKLTLIGEASSTNLLTATDKNTSLTFTGDGTLDFSLSGQRSLVYGNWTFDVATTANNSFYLYSGKGGIVTFKKNFTSTNQLSVGDGWVMNLENGMTFKCNGFNYWGNSTLNTELGTTVNSTAGVNITNGSLSGSIISIGRQTYQTNHYVSKFKNTTFNSTATLNISASSDYSTLFNGNVVSNAATGALKIGSRVVLTGTSSSLTLNSSNALLIAGATSQATSKLHIGTQVLTKPASGSTYTETWSRNDAFLNVNATNEFGSFVFKDDSTLTVVLDGKSKFTFAGINPWNSGEEGYQMIFKNLTDFTVKIMSLDNISIDSETLDANTLIQIDASGYEDFVYLVEDTVNGGWWINTSSVPEPSTVAALLGAIAMGFVLIRRRK